jgi:probable HAF family extracellular repeat protein
MTLNAFRLLFVGAVLLFAAPTFAQQYTVTYLGKLPGARQSYATAINAGGQVVGVSDIGGGTEDWHPFLWTEGTMQDLGQLPGFRQCVPRAINDRGHVIGTCSNPSSQAFLWTADTGSMALAPPGSEGWGINNQDDMVGDYTADDGKAHAFLYRGGEFRDLGNGVAFGINDQGQIVGSAAGPHAALWDEDGQHDLGSLEGSTSGVSVAFAVSAEGLIVGRSTTGEGSGFYHAVLWTPYGISNLGTLGTGHDAAATAISGDLIVGSSNTIPEGDLAALLYDNNGPGYPVNLNDLIPADSGWQLTFATGVNASGQLVGAGVSRDQSGWRAFLLTPVPASTSR